MRVIIVKNYDTGEEITRFKTARLANLFSDLNRVMSKEKDPLHLGKEYSVDCGIISSTERGLILSNDPRVINGKGDICYTGPNTEVFGSKVNSHTRPPRNVIIWTKDARKELDLRLAVTAYPEGYVLNTGKMSTNFLGTRKLAYLVSIGRCSFRSSFKSGAHIFSSIKSLVNYVKKYERDLEYMVKTYGYCFSVEPGCSLFASSLENIPVKDQKYLPELEALLDKINAADAEEDDEKEELAGTATAEEMKEEAVKRLHSLRVMENPVVREFLQSGKIYRSEPGGILFDLDENSQKALSVFKEEWGYLPYAVIVSYMEFGTMYTVLFVSPNKDEWGGERPNPKDGCCCAYVYNADAPTSSELGEVCVEGANGGLNRIF